MSARAQDDPFDALYAQSTDPWGTRTRWYERRKRALLMAALPHESYDAVYEVGCGTGHISIELAERSGSLLASDGSEAALVVARAALRHRPNVSVVRHRLPGDWPHRPFDLIVLGEMIYFVDAHDGARIAQSTRASAGARGTVVACDWRGFITGYGHTGEEAHRRFERALDLPRVCEYLDEDFVLTVWSRNAASVATVDGVK